MSGFSEDVMPDQNFNFAGADAKLDVVTGLLVMGFYPNVCYHLQKRKVMQKCNYMQTIVCIQTIVCSQSYKNLFLEIRGVYWGFLKS